MRHRNWLVMATLIVVVGLLSACEKKAEHKEEANVYYTCPMHPQVNEKKPGKCPICGMDLVKKEIEGDGHNESDPNHKH